MKRILTIMMLTVLMLMGTVVANAETTTPENDYDIKNVTIYSMKSTTNGSCVVGIANRTSKTPDYYKFEFQKDGRVIKTYTSGVNAFAAHGLSSGNYSVRISTYKDGVEMDSYQSKEVYAKYDLRPEPPRITMVRSYHVKSDNKRAIKVEMETKGQFKEFKVDYYRYGVKVGNFTTTDTEFVVDGLNRGWHTIVITPVLENGETYRPMYTYGYARLRP